MKTIDGSARSGSGTIVRHAVALASLLGREVRIDNIRAGRPKPGLRAQHLKVVQACGEICRAEDTRCLVWIEADHVHAP